MTTITCTASFLSTLSLRRATCNLTQKKHPLTISIHALLAESDNTNLGRHRGNNNFYPRSPCGERQTAYFFLAAGIEFLSTLSLRRATELVHERCKFNRFLSTLSLRRATPPVNTSSVKVSISIHALLAESDRSARPETRQRGAISIHALLAESDGGSGVGSWPHRIFLSTLSLRRATIISQHSAPNNGNFYPRSPCGERQLAAQDESIMFVFLSTLSLRRATAHYDNYNLHCVISIHALLAESDSSICATVSMSF